MSESVVTQAAVPMLSYEDVRAAVDWLCSAFGFTETGERYEDDHGRVTHAEIERNGALLSGMAGRGLSEPGSPCRDL